METRVKPTESKGKEKQGNSSWTLKSEKVELHNVEMLYGSDVSLAFWMRCKLGAQALIELCYGRLRHEISITLKNKTFIHF